MTRGRCSAGSALTASTMVRVAVTRERLISALCAADHLVAIGSPAKPGHAELPGVVAKFKARCSTTSGVCGRCRLSIPRLLSHVLPSLPAQGLPPHGSSLQSINAGDCILMH